MLALFLLTVVLGQFVSNTATVLIVLPVALAAAAEAQVSAEPILMMIAVARAASFLTPIATPANMIVMGPAGYRFGDYWRLGLPVLGWWTVVALVLVPMVWPLWTGHASSVCLGRAEVRRSTRTPSSAPITALPTIR